jgi:hypothetical protein
MPLPSMIALMVPSGSAGESLGVPRSPDRDFE